MFFNKKEEPKRTVTQAISAFTKEFEEIKVEQEAIAQEAIDIKEEVLAEARHEARIQDEIAEAANIEAARATNAIDKFKDFFNV